MIIQDNEGNDVEVFSPEEVDEMVSQKVQDELSKQNPDKEKNLSSLRTKSEFLEKELEMHKAKVEELEKLPEQMKGQMLGEYKEDAFKNIRLSDEEKAKVNFYFDSFKDSMDSKEKIAERIKDSLRLSGIETGEKSKFEMTFGGTGSGTPASYDGSDNSFAQNSNANVMGMAKEFGISNETLNKYGK